MSSSDSCSRETSSDDPEGGREVETEGREVGQEVIGIKAVSCTRGWLAPPERRGILNIFGADKRRQGNWC